MGNIMKVSDYIVEFLIKKEITDVFGYPGGMLTHFMDSLHKRKDIIKTHINYHEQASSFSACGYAQVSHKPGVAFATSGPGATNLITGIANAYYDNIPTIFITGQVNTNELKDNLNVRQKGFQETDIVSIVQSITKYSVLITNPNDIQKELNKAYLVALSGRPGPVLLDIPMNVFRSEMEIAHEKKEELETVSELNSDLNQIFNLLKESKRPVIIAGNGIKTSNQITTFREFVSKLGIPVVSSMIGFDILAHDNPLNYGFIGAYGHRCANFIVAKSDLVISIGSRLDVRQVGGIKKNFAQNAKLIRLDIDAGEFTNKIKDDELQILIDIRTFLSNISESSDFLKPDWLKVCDSIRKIFLNKDKENANILIEKISEKIPDLATITTDVGQNQVWIAQSFKNKPYQKILFSGGHAAMGYSLPAAIGAFYASNELVISFNGDGGIQMNIQELQFIAREKLPIKIIIMNNNSLGMISHFQEMYFNSNYAFTIENEGYSNPDFRKIANAYGLKYVLINNLESIDQFNFNLEPEIYEITLDRFTHVYPKLEFGKPNQDQEPLIDRALYDQIMSL